MCIDIVEICFEIANEQICQLLTELSARHTSVFSLPSDNLSKYQRIFTNLSMWIDFMELCVRIAIGQISLIFFYSYLPATW